MTPDEIITTLVDTPSKRLLGGALGFLRAAELIYEQNGEQTWATSYVNIGFGTELALKSFVVHHGGGEKEMRGLGHDLVAAFNECVRIGYRPFEPQLAFMVAAIGPTHMDHSIRYLKGQGASLPPVSLALKFLTALIVDIYEQSDPPSDEQRRIALARHAELKGPR